MSNDVETFVIRQAALQNKIKREDVTHNTNIPDVHQYTMIASIKLGKALIIRGSSDGNTVEKMIKLLS